MCNEQTDLVYEEQMYFENMHDKGVRYQSKWAAFYHDGKFSKNCLLASWNSKVLFAPKINFKAEKAWEYKQSCDAKLKKKSQW